MVLLILLPVIVGCGDPTYTVGYLHDAGSDTVQSKLPDELNFLVLGDWGRRGNWQQQAVADQMAAVADTLECDFVISTGDNFYPDGVTGINDSHWLETFENVYSAPSLHIPWYPVLGNHDYNGNTKAQIEYSQISSRWQFPARNYSKVYDVGGSFTVQLVFFDTMPLLEDFGADPWRHLQWLDETLGETDSDWKMVIGHHPVYSSGNHGNTDVLIEELVPILEYHQVTAYFCGHDHDLEHLKPDGPTHYIVSGAGSSVRPVNPTDITRFSQSIPGFVVVRVYDKSFTLAFIDYEGNLLYEFFSQENKK